MALVHGTGCPCQLPKAPSPWRTFEKDRSCSWLGPMAEDSWRSSPESILVRRYHARPRLCPDGDLSASGEHSCLQTVGGPWCEGTPFNRTMFSPQGVLYLEGHSTGSGTAEGPPGVSASHSSSSRVVTQRRSSRTRGRVCTGSARREARRAVTHSGRRATNAPWERLPRRAGMWWGERWWREGRKPELGVTELWVPAPLPSWKWSVAQWFWGLCNGPPRSG